MSQHDMVIDDADGATVLADMNNAFQALASTSKGSAAPGTPYAGQPWIDDNTPSSSKWSRYIHDGTDSIKVGEIDTTNNVVVQQVGGGAAQSIASAATIDLGSVFEASIVVTGSTGPVTSFSNTAPIGAFKFVKFSSTPTLTHNATSLILPGGANIVAEAGDTLVAEHLGSGNWRVHHYQRNQVPPLSGTYTPTATTGTNMAAATPSAAQWYRVGNCVTVSGYVNLDSTSTGAAECGLSLPVASNFSAVQHCAGTAASVGASGENPGVVTADATNDRASVNIIAVNTGNITWYYHYTYQVI